MVDAGLTPTGANLIAGSESGQGDDGFTAIDPRTGRVGSVRFHEATESEIHSAARTAAESAPALADASPSLVVALLRAIADELVAQGDALVGQADAETGLGQARLAGERDRTTMQLRAFAELVASGRHHEAVVDPGDASAVPPRPDLRRMQIPVGPVAVFGASNFPLAFSVPGGDTAAAFAAGCPVVVKAHPSHPGTSELASRAILAAIRRVGLPDGVFSMVQGAQPEVGQTLVLAPEIQAVGFTGSFGAGRALFELATRRTVPIPVYAEMGSINPVFVTSGAAAARRDAIAGGFAGSMTLGTGQFCTKPGIVFVPDDGSGDALVDALVGAVAAVDSSAMLNAGIHRSLTAQLENTVALPGLRTLVDGHASQGPGWLRSATLLEVDLDEFLDRPELHEEHFGPVSIVVRTSVNGFAEAAAALPGSLTATIHGEEDDLDDLERLISVLRDRAGRLIWNGFPTGVAVSPAQHHGGPWPAATMSAHTSVGAMAIRRFLRPVAYQNAPEAMLPLQLRDANPLAVPRLVDGTYTTKPIDRAVPRP